MNNSELNPLDSRPKSRRPNLIVRFFRFIGSLIRGYFIAVGVFATLIPLGLFYALSHLEPSQQLLPKTKAFDPFDKLILHLKLDQLITERRRRGADLLFDQLFNDDRSLDMSDLIKALRRARDDIRIQGVFVELGSLRANGANISEIREAFQYYKESNKPLSFHLTSPSTEHYYLASVGDHLSIAETDQLALTGPLFTLTYFKDMLSKLGIEFQVVRAGKYKSAMEPFVENAPSEATLEMYDSMERALLQHFVDYVAPKRKKTPDEVRQWLKKSFHTAGEALALGIVDEIGYLPEVRAKFVETSHEGHLTTLGKYLDGSSDMDKPLTASGREKIGYVEAFGTIVMDPVQGSSEPFITPEEMTDQLKFMADDDDVRAVVVRIVSPGGSAIASDLIWHEMSKLASKKPVIVSMGGVAASGGYYIAAPAQKIIADPTSITGSIGVISAIPRATSVQEKWGISFYVVSSSDRKDLFNFSKKMSDDDFKVLSSQTEDFYKTFLKRVSDGRHKSVEDIHSLAQGRVYTGSMAYGLGLVDGLGGLRQALQEAKTAADLDPTKLYALQTYRPKPRSAFDCVGLSFEDTVKCMEQLETILPNFHTQLSNYTLGPELSYVRRWQQFFQESRTAYLAPFDLVEF